MKIVEIEYLKDHGKNKKGSIRKEHQSVADVLIDLKIAKAVKKAK